VWQSVVKGGLPIILAKEPPKGVPWLAVGLTRQSIDIILTKRLRIVEAIGAEVTVAWALMEPVH
jgi:hypothetical protein